MISSTAMIFTAAMPDLQNRLKTLQIAVENTVETLKAEQAVLLQTESVAIQSSQEWSRIGLDDQNRLSARLDKLQPEAPLSLAGLKKLFGHQYALSTELDRVKSEVRELAKPKPPEPTPEGEKPVEEVTLSFPSELASEADADPSSTNW